MSFIFTEKELRSLIDNITKEVSKSLSEILMEKISKKFADAVVSSKNGGFSEEKPNERQKCLYKAFLAEEGTEMILTESQIKSASTTAVVLKKYLTSKGVSYKASTAKPELVKLAMVAGGYSDIKSIGEKKGPKSSEEIPNKKILNSKKGTKSSEEVPSKKVLNSKKETKSSEEIPSKKVLNSKKETKSSEEVPIKKVLIIPSIKDEERRPKPNTSKSDGDDVEISGGDSYEQGRVQYKTLLKESTKKGKSSESRKDSDKKPMKVAKEVVLPKEATPSNSHEESGNDQENIARMFRVAVEKTTKK